MGGGASSSSVAHTASTTSTVFVSTTGVDDGVGSVRIVGWTAEEEEREGRVEGADKGGMTAGEAAEKSVCSLCSSAAGLFRSSMGGAGNVVMRLAAMDVIIGCGQWKKQTDETGMGRLSGWQDGSVPQTASLSRVAIEEEVILNHDRETSIGLQLESSGSRRNKPHSQSRVTGAGWAHDDSRERTRTWYIECQCRRKAASGRVTVR